MFAVYTASAVTAFSGILNVMVFPVVCGVPFTVQCSKLYPTGPPVTGAANSTSVPYATPPDTV